MIRFDFQNCLASAIGPEHGVSEEELVAFQPDMDRAQRTFEGWRASGDASFFDVAALAHLTTGIAEKAREVQENFENLVVFGIGGSALGPRFLANALLPPLYNFLSSKERRGPRLFVCDNIDPDTFAALLHQVGLKKTCFNIISKSGRTIETAAQTLIVIDQLKQSLGAAWRDHLVMTTDPQEGALREMVKHEGIASFPIPVKLGGRFSVLSPVGLFPAACVGIDVAALLAGAKECAKRCLSASLKENPAARLAAFQYLLDVKHGKKISVMMPYADSLALFADWYAQLWGESLGKEGKGTTPLKSLGATDQHSLLQLYMEGPNDKVVTFLGVERFRHDPKETRVPAAGAAFDFLTGHDLGAILNAERCGTADALTQVHRPNLTVTLPELSARHIGQLIMCYEMATALSGALYGVNPFDQPGVELSKSLTREILSKR